MGSARKSALLTGVFFIITFVTSIPALVLYGPVLDDAHYILGAGADNRVLTGAFLEVILAIAGIGTAVTLFPILKRQSEGVALGYVTARVFESAMIAVGIVSLMAVLTLRQDFAAHGAGAASFVVAGKALVAVHKWTFVIGPAFVPGIGNGLLLGYLMYRSRLVPRRLAMLGLAGGSLATIAATLELFGVFQQVSAGAAIVTLPEAVWEASLGIWLIVKGFRPSPVIAEAASHSLVGEAAAPGPAAG